jgi:hypothetical protein
MPAAGGMTRPVWPPYREEESRKDDADHMVNDPPDRKLTTNRRSRRDVLVHEPRARELADPAADHCVFNDGTPKKHFRSAAQRSITRVAPTPTKAAHSTNFRSSLTSHTRSQWPAFPARGLQALAPD